ncbi:MAG: DUF4129 domain-containing protein, partial [bacterium]
ATPPARNETARATSIISYEKARENLDQILKAKEFESRRMPTSLVGRILRNALDRLGDLFPEGFMESLQNSATILIVTLAAALLLYILYSAYKMWKPRRRAVVLNEGGPAAHSPSAMELLREARQALASTDFRRFITLYYCAFLLLLDERDILLFVPSRTNWECWKELRRVPPAAPALEPLKSASRFYDIVIFGNRPATPAECERYRALLEEAAAALQIRLA